MVAIHWLQMLSYIFMDPSDTLNDKKDDFYYSKVVFLNYCTLYIHSAGIVERGSNWEKTR